MAQSRLVAPINTINATSANTSSNTSGTGSSSSSPTTSNTPLSSSVSSSSLADNSLSHHETTASAMAGYTQLVYDVEKEADMSRPSVDTVVPNTNTTHIPLLAPVSPPPPPPPPRADDRYIPENALDDIPGIRHVVDLFLASHMLESEEYCQKMDPFKDRLYYASGYGLIQSVKALMSYEDDDLLTALGHTRHGNTVAQAHRKKSASITSRIAGLVTGCPTSGVGWVKSMTPVERHAELIYAETLFEKALLGIVYSGDWLAFIKEALNLRSTFTTYRLLHKYLVTVDEEARQRGEGPEDTSIDVDFRSGVQLGAGLSNIIVSLMPARIASLVELFGFTGSRVEGLTLLYAAGGWGVPSSSSSTSSTTNKSATLVDFDELAEPLIDAKHEGVRRSICDMTLLIFHLFLSSFTSEGVSMRAASRIISYNLRRYPRGVFFLFGQGRLQFIRAQPADAIVSFRASMQAQTQYRNLHLLILWEMALAWLALGKVKESLECWRTLEKEATWSKACYAYGIAVCLLDMADEDVDGDKEKAKQYREEAARFLAKIPSQLGRIAGKSIPMEKFIARKARKFEKQRSRLALPQLEYSYFFMVISSTPACTIGEKMLPQTQKMQAKLRKYADSPGSYEGGRGYWDDLCLTNFLEGVCYRFLAWPDSDAVVNESEKWNIPREEAEKRAMAAFQAVLDNGPKIELDHYLVYCTHFEIGRLCACMGKRDEARMHFDLVLSGKPLEVNSSSRKGKYSLESALMLRTHAAVEALEHPA